MGATLLLVKKDKVAIYDRTSGIFLTDPKGVSPIGMVRLLETFPLLRKRLTHYAKRVSQLDLLNVVRNAATLHDYRHYNGENPFTIHRTETSDRETAKEMSDFYAKQSKVLKRVNL